MNYLNELREHGIHDNLKHLKKIRKKTVSFLEKYTIEHPKNMSIILNGGGLVKDSIDKLKQVQIIFQQLEGMNKDATLETQSKKIIEKLDELIIKIKRLPVPTNITNNPNSGNSLETLVAKITNTTSKFDVEPTSLNIRVPKIPVSEFQTKTIKRLFEDLQREISNYKGEDDYSRDEAGVKQSVSVLRTLVQENEKKLVTTINSLETSIKEIEKTYGYDISDDDYKKISFTRATITSLEFQDRENENASYGNLVKAIFLKYEKSSKKNKDYEELVKDYNKIVYMYGRRGFYEGINTSRIINNFIINDPSSLQKLDLVSSVIGDASSGFDDRDIYNPNFDDKGKFAGGSLNDVKSEIATLSESIQRYYEKYDVYFELVNKYNKYQIDNTIHTLFLTLIITNQLYPDVYVIYLYIPKGGLTFYSRIIDDILSHFGRDHTGQNAKLFKYLEKYHSVTLIKLKNFLDGLIKKMGVNDIIDIRKCDGETANRFMILNYFKPILEAFRTRFQSQVSIYARINDIPKNILDEHCMFTSSRDNFKELKINSRVCQALSSPGHDAVKYNSVNFAEVFDSKSFSENSTISNYMSINTQISEDKGVALLTYGYSGTGKTFTLFGNETKGGLLQSVLNEINNLESVRFRLFEIYGMGIPYSYYWTDDHGMPNLNSIEHKIIHHNLKLLGTDIGYDTSVNKTIILEGADIKKYVECQGTCGSGLSCVPCNFVDILGVNIDKVLKNFKSLMDTVDLERIQHERIRQTPNNNVSSRSILVYDFRVKVKGSKKDFTQFLIIDLPGREEILQTYVDRYFENVTVMNIFTKSLYNSKPLSDHTKDPNVLRVKMLLSSMALNPIAVPIYANKFYKIFNDNISKKIRREVLNFSYDLDTGQSNTSGTILNDKINYNTSGVTELSYFATLKDDEINLVSRHRIYDSPSPGWYGFGYNKSDPYQYESLIGIYVMNHLLVKKKFDDIMKIFKVIVDENFNNYMKFDDVEIDGLLDRFKHNNFKGEMITQYENIFSKLLKKEGLNDEETYAINMLQDDGKYKYKNETMNELNKMLLNKVLHYDYLRTPWEGVYINENIVGLIKYMIDKLTRSSGTGESIYDIQQIIQQIPIDFKFKRNESRMLMITDNSLSKQEIATFFDPSQRRDAPIEKTLEYTNTKKPVLKPGTIKRNGAGATGDPYKVVIPEPIFNIAGDNATFIADRLIKEYDDLKGSYKPNRLFNFENPLIQTILQPYLNVVSEYKMFYLLGNYNDDRKDMKCEHQYNLLEQSYDFISAIETSNKPDPNKKY
jgi:hypothetical protein